jgi:methylenetetrahydrofolate dehydrogenase (NADP+)/methenyltetrahydrofolate cyclohydrolase/formyltetrahydrofolate synthetase
LLQKLAKEAGAYDAVLCTHFAEGGKGAIGLAKSVISACEAQRQEGNTFKVNTLSLPSYPLTSLLVCL